MNIGQLTPVPLREVWAHEARDFTVWLSDNLPYLDDLLNTELTLTGREVSARAFAADIVCEDAQGNAVLIENQLMPTDHDHLGKLITYMSNLDAKTAVWVTIQPRPEHETAVHWLNELLPADTSFYLVKIEAFRIGDSPPAPLFTIVAGPTPEGRQAGAIKKETAESHLRRLQFWEQLLAKAATRSQLHANISPSKDHWLSAGAGTSGVAFNYIILKDKARIELYIDTGDRQLNKRIFDHLITHREAVDTKFGAPILWDRLDQRNACRISHALEIGGLDDQDKWPQIQTAMVDAMDRFHKAIAPYIKRP